MIKLTKILVGVIVTPLIIFSIIFVIWKNSDSTSHNETSSSTTKTNKSVQKTENGTETKPVPGSRILRFEGYTPYEKVIDFSFEIETDGDPVSIKFPGIPEKYSYSGKGRQEFSGDEKRTPGKETTITSKTGSPVRVRIYETY